MPTESARETSQSSARRPGPNAGPHADRTQRAPRYAVPVTVLYRAAGDSTWYEGRTENISESGVLVRSDRPMEPETSVEMFLAIPDDVAAPFAGTTICRGRIVRAIGRSEVDDLPAFAAAIQEYDTGVNDPRRI